MTALAKLKYLAKQDEEIRSRALFDAVRQLDAKGITSPFTLVAEWTNYKKNDPKLWTPPVMNRDLDIADWRKRRSADSCTYEKCISAAYRPSKGTIQVMISEGDYDGYPTTPRCSFTLTGVTPKRFVEHFSAFAHLVENHFSYLVSIEWERQEAARLAAIRAAQEEEIAQAFLVKVGYEE